MRITVYTLFIYLAIFACKSDPDRKTQPSGSVENLPRKELRVPAFNADSAYHFIEEQVNMGPRVPNSEAHRKTRDYLEKQLSRYADNVIVQPFSAMRFDRVDLQGYNIIGVFNPEAKKRILLLAHWDTRYVADYASSEELKKQPVVGADDGGSGVGVLLEIARQLSLQVLTGR